MSTQQVANLYIELDVLLDTRLGTIARFYGVDVAEKVLLNKYHKRKFDNFPDVERDTFLEQYRQRDVMTLAHSKITNAIKLLQRLISALREQAINTPYHKQVKVVVNCYPYSLSDLELDAIGKALRVWTHDLAPVELVCIPPKDLTPEHCKSEYLLMLVYEYEDWLNLHSEAFKTTRLPEVTMYAPAIYFNQEPSAEELEKISREAAHPLWAMETLASPLIKLELHDIYYFSVLTKDAEPAYSPTPSGPVASSTDSGEVDVQRTELSP
jgi:hypothetical protein